MIHSFVRHSFSWGNRSKRARSERNAQRLASPFTCTRRYRANISDANMNRQSSRTDLNENSIESDPSYPPTKRHCSSPSLQRSLSNSSSSVLAHLTPGAIDSNRDGCKSCGKQERLLKTFNCPSLHCFCLNCIFGWTQTHIQVGERSRDRQASHRSFL